MQNQTAPYIRKIYLSNRTFLIRNVIVWLCLLFIFEGINILLNGPTLRISLDVLLFTFEMFVIFTLAFLLTDLFLRQDTIHIFIVGIFAILAVNMFVMYQINMYDYNSNPTAYATTSFGDFMIPKLLLSFVYFLLFFVMGVAFCYGRNATRDRKAAFKKEIEFRDNKFLMEQRNFELQKELLLSENNYLRAQINPHFLYNCLNFLYAETYTKAPNAAEAVMLLSQMMRYSIKDFSVSGGMTYLEEEFQNILNIVELNRFRFGTRMQVVIEREGDFSGKMICPMLLSTLVENVFKHGNVLDEEHPVSIKCTIDDDEQKVLFSTSNLIAKKQKSLLPGIGLENIKHRLNLLYDNDYSFVTAENDGFFNVTLTVPFNLISKLNAVA